MRPGDYEKRSMPKIDTDAVPDDAGTNYPEQYRAVVAGRSRKRLGNAAGLTQFGVNVATLKPGAASSLRHWHRDEDEFVYVLQGEVVLVEDEGETVLKPGDAAAWKANGKIGHHLVNRTAQDAVFIEVGSRAPQERVEYSDVEMVMTRDGATPRYTRKNNEPY